MATGAIKGRVGTPLPHESAHLHVSGEARYTDDIPEPAGILHAAIGMSERAHARINRIDLEAVRTAPGVVCLITAADIPGANNIGALAKDDPIFADGLVQCVGQSMFAVAATSARQARRAARLAVVEYEELEPILDVDTALEKKSFVLPSKTMVRGDAKEAIRGAAHRLRGTFRFGGQDHFYLEGQIAIALPREDGDMLIYSSTQHPGDVQAVVARALGRTAKDVVVECRRMGGAFGGKETQASLFPAIAALLASRTGRAVKLRLDRDADMVLTGKRHAFRVDYDVGFDAGGVIQGVDFMLASRCGMSADLSGPVNDRAMNQADNAYRELVPELERSSRYRDRRREIDDYNASSEILKRGLALTPVKYGISFTTTHLNQAGALLNVYADGSVQLNHGGTEMGQGLFTKVAQVVAEELQIDVGLIRCTASDTSKVPNASETAASTGSDLNGMAALAAARTIKQRLIDFAAGEYDVPVSQIEFRDGLVHIGEERLSFAELTKLAWLGRVSLSATGFYRTPEIHYDRLTLSGRPFYYFAYGAAVSEVVIDVLTGEYKVVRVDALHDAGSSLNPAIDKGQVEGAFIQGMGWLTTEELWWNDRGELMTHAPSTYKIPVAGDLPEVFNVELFRSGRNVEPTIHRSKAVGEPPLMLSISVFHAIKDAVASVGRHRLSPRLSGPATPEEVLMSIEDLKRRLAAKKGRTAPRVKSAA